ncbi:MAG: hypothetical protein ABI556_14140 [Gemmatimonadales bacterium]
MTFASSGSSAAKRLVASTILAVALILVACTGGTPTESVVPSAIGIVTGNGQSAQTGAALVNPLVVEVLDQNATVMQNVTVNWTIVTGGGSLNTTASLTDAAGHASARYTAGPVAGTATIRAAVSGIPNPVVFMVTVTPGGAS